MKEQKSIVTPMLILIGMFSILGFAVGIDAYFIPFVKKAFNISNTMSYLVITATYASFVIFSIPSGILIKKIGYKMGIVAAFILLSASFFLIGMASNIFSFLLFLGALFINGMGRVMLNATINPYITILGPQESAAKRISIMGISNKLSYAGASFILAVFLDLSNVNMQDMTTPFYIISGIILIMGIFSHFLPLPDVKAEGENDKTIDSLFVPENIIIANAKTSIFQFPHVLLGTIAYFFYTGVEVTALGSINQYAVILGLPSPQNYVWLTSLSMVIGYLIGVIFIPKVLSQVTAIRMSALLGLLLTILIFLAPVNISIYFIALLGLANALILPAIWPLSLADLGKFTKIGSGLLVTGGIGGAIIPLIYGLTVDLSSSYQKAYLICLIPYIFILYFSLKGYNIRSGNMNVGTDKASLRR
ncbi:MAG: MFS transporter [Porphyromonadaceae bacterium]|nr:MFS transporter [Porphyromonadaceae bacterium]